MDQSNKYNFNTNNNFKNSEIDQTNDLASQKNFMNGLQNARKLLEGLERSIQKSSQYEARLLRCRTAHRHSHSHHSHDDHQWPSDCSDVKSRETNVETAKSSRNLVDLTESWSTMSIVCLQYQYEELSKRYESLLQAYHERCRSASDREQALAQLNEHIKEAHAQLAHVHKTLISIGEKYLKLWHKKRAQKQKYERRINHLNATVRGIMAMCEQARLELDNRLTHFLERELQAPSAQLLAEIKKCNLLYLENLRLKAEIENLVPGFIFSEKL